MREGYYAEINEDNICFRVLHHSAISEFTDRFIFIGDYDEKYLEAVYNPENGEFTFPEKLEPIPAVETVEQKIARLEEQNIILMDALADLYEEILALKGEDV